LDSAIQRKPGTNCSRIASSKNEYEYANGECWHGAGSPFVGESRRDTRGGLTWRGERTTEIGRGPSQWPGGCHQPRKSILLVFESGRSRSGGGPVSNR